MEKVEITINGLSHFFFFAIPAVLGLAALYWLAFGEGLHYFRRALSQERRHAEIVGAKRLPKEPITIKATNSKTDPIVIDRAEIDGSDLWIYYRNITDFHIGNIKFTWRLIAPDGTVLKSEEGKWVSIFGLNNAADSLNAGERGELHLKIHADPRAVTLEIRMSGY